MAESVLWPVGDQLGFAYFWADQTLAFPETDGTGFLAMRLDPVAKGRPHGFGQLFGETCTGFLCEGDVAWFGEFAGNLHANPDVPLLEVNITP